MEKTTQELFDELVAARGAEAVIAAVKAHRPHPDGGTGCVHDSDCQTGYYCNGGSCTLKVGP